MNRHDIKKLASYQAYPCVSLLLPTSRHAPQNQQDPIRVKNLIKQATARLHDEFGKREVAGVIADLEALADEIDYQHTLDGLALFVSPDMAEKHYLPFPVTERVMIDESFATRDLTYMINRSPSYWLLALSEKPTRLYEGLRNNLVEVFDEGFPMVHTLPGGEAPLPGGRGVKVSAYRDERHRQFFRQIDEALGKIIADDPRPVFIAAVDRYHAFFEEVTAHTRLLAGRIEGSYDKTPIHELGDRIWPIVQEYTARQKAGVIDDLAAAVGAQKAASGIGEAWRMAQEGRGLRLIVEESFVYPARLDETGLQLTPAEDPTAPDVIDDAVDELIELVIEKGGDVTIVEDGALATHQRLGLILRY